jgi:hypothetical protein
MEWKIDTTRNTEGISGIKNICRNVVNRLIKVDPDSAGKQNI